MRKKYSHIPIIPLGLDKRDLAINKELVVDKDTNNIYLFNNNQVMPDDLITAMQKRLQADRRHEILSPDQRKVYGVDIDLDESNPTLAVRYTEDATGFENMYIDHTDNEHLYYGTWEKVIEEIFEPTPVLMEHGKEVCRLRHEDYNFIKDEPYGTNAIFGFEMDVNTGEIKYTDKAIGYIPIEVGEASRDYGSWKDFLIKFIGLKPTAYKDGELYDLDPNHYDVKTSQDYIEDNNIMIRYSHNYYYVKLTADKLIFRVANYKPNDDFIDEIFIDEQPFYMGAYEGTTTDGKLESKTNKEIIPGYEGEDINTILLAKRYLYVFCLGLLVSKQVDMARLGCDYTFHYDNTEGEPNLEYRPYGYTYGSYEPYIYEHGTYREDYQALTQIDKTGITDDDGFFTARSFSTKSMGSENLYGNGGFLANGAYADQGKLILELPDTTSEDDTITINRVVYLENRLLMYKNHNNNIDLAFGTDDAIFYVTMPARLVI